MSRRLRQESSRVVSDLINYYVAITISRAISHSGAISNVLCKFTERVANLSVSPTFTPQQHACARNKLQAER